MKSSGLYQAIALQQKQLQVAQPEQLHKFRPRAQRHSLLPPQRQKQLALPTRRGPQDPRTEHGQHTSPTRRGLLDPPKQRDSPIRRGQQGPRMVQERPDGLD